VNRRPQFCPHCGNRLREQPWDGRARPVCETCGHVVYLNPAPSVAVILRREERVLLVKRNIEPGLGLWSLPGGFIEEDEDVEQAVIREVEEETGLSCRPRGLLDAHGMRSAIYGSVLVLCYSAEIVDGHLQPGGDAEEAAFFPLRDLPEIAFDIHRRFLERHLHGRMTTSIKSESGFPPPK
jgi:8-oxo-dGTP diphosphatase